MEENKTKKSNTVWRVIFIFACIVLALCIVWFSIYFFKKPADTEGFKTSSTAQNVSSEPQLPDNPIDFAALQEQNPDVYAWIEIPGTEMINYPVVQPYEEDDDFYLTHDWLKQYEDDGAIYSEKQNSKDFSDPNTVLYGHNMRTGAMFRKLHNFKDKDFFEENKYIYIYTPGHILTYEIFAAYKSDNRHILNSYNFNDEEVFANYLKDIQNPASMVVNTRQVELTTESKILTLSTCINDKNYRYLVQGVLINDELTK